MEPTAGKCFTSLIFVSHFVWTTLVKRSIHPFVVDLSQNRGSASINQKWFKSDLSITKSCSLNFMGLLYIYGGLYEKRQVLKLDWCRNYIWYRNIVYPLFCGFKKKTDNFSSCDFFKHSFKNSRTGKKSDIIEGENILIPTEQHDKRPAGIYQVNKSRSTSVWFHRRNLCRQWRCFCTMFRFNRQSDMLSIRICGQHPIGGRGSSQ